MLVDTCAMRMIQNPTYFDVLVTENTFGDILTDEASMLAGSMGMLPSASLAGIPEEGERIFGLYEPIHGSAPTIAGKNDGQPHRHHPERGHDAALFAGPGKRGRVIEQAVEDVLKEGYRTMI